MVTLLGALSAIAVQPAVAHAADPRNDDTQPVTLRELIVVAKGWEEDATGATAAVAGIDGTAIRRRRQTHVDRALREVPGVQVLRDGPAGQLSRLHVRGAASNQTLVVIDGIPQNDATTGGGYDFGDLTSHAVGRVEVLRGSYGVLYGSEAIGGVVRVETRRGAGEPSARVLLEGGSFGTHREHLWAGFGEDGIDLAFSVGNFRTQGERDREDHRTTDVSARVGWEPNDRVRLEWTYRGAGSRTESPFDFPTTTLLPEDDNIDRSRDTISTGLNARLDANDWLTLRAAVSLLDLDSRFRNGPDGPTTIDPDFTPGSGDESVVVRDEFSSRNEQRDLRGRLSATAFVGEAIGWRSADNGGVDLELTVGGETLWQRSTSKSISPDFNARTETTTRRRDTIDTDALFAQATLRLPDIGPARGLTFTTGARRDRHETFGVGDVAVPGCTGWTSRTPACGCAARTARDFARRSRRSSTTDSWATRTSAPRRRSRWTPRSGRACWRTA